MDRQFKKHLTANLIIGSFPYCENEIQEMMKADVKAVLNINNYGEYKCDSINWDIITQKYAMNNIEFVDYLFDESNISKDCEYIEHAAGLLNEMI